MATKKPKAEWPFSAGTAPKAKKPTKKELEAQKLAEQEKLIATLNSLHAVIMSACGVMVVKWSWALSAERSMITSRIIS
jgi:hypothetical protein